MLMLRHLLSSTYCSAFHKTRLGLDPEAAMNTVILKLKTVNFSLTVSSAPKILSHMAKWNQSNWQRFQIPRPGYVFLE